VDEHSCFLIRANHLYLSFSWLHKLRSRFCNFSLPEQNFHWWAHYGPNTQYDLIYDLFRQGCYPPGLKLCDAIDIDRGKVLVKVEV
jgi:hypothetical protein